MKPGATSKWFAMAMYAIVIITFERSALAQIGGCCFSDGTCLDLSPTQCFNQGGLYQANNNFCSNDTCPGACCLPDNTCEFVSPGTCASHRGEYVGDGVTCEAVSCPVAPPCPADIDQPGGSGHVGVPDLLFIINNWGPCANPNDCPADLAPIPTGDDTVGVPDLLFIINNWGPCP